MNRLLIIGQFAVSHCIKNGCVTARSGAMRSFALSDMENVLFYRGMYGELGILEIAFAGLLMVVSAIVIFRCAVIEYVNPWLWCELSVFVSMLTWRVLGWGVIGVMVGQVLLFAAFYGDRIYRAYQASYEESTTAAQRVRPPAPKPPTGPVTIDRRALQSRRGLPRVGRRRLE
jgi:hypothetical protein